MILGIFGAGGNGKTLADAADIINGLMHKWEKIVFVDDVVGVKKHYTLDVYTYQEVKEQFSKDEIEIVISLGEPANRKKIHDMLKRDGFKLGQVISPRAIMPLDCKLGEGIILLDCIIGSDVVIGDNTFVSENAIIGHDTIVGEDSIVGPKVFIAGHCRIGNEVYVGPCAILRDRLTIEDHGVVSIGAVVFKTVFHNSVAIGNPARNMPKDDNHKLFK